LDAGAKCRREASDVIEESREHGERKNIIRGYIINHEKFMARLDQKKWKKRVPRNNSVL